MACPPFVDDIFDFEVYPWLERTKTGGTYCKAGAGLDYKYFSLISFPAKLRDLSLLCLLMRTSQRGTASKPCVVYPKLSCC